MAWVITRDLLNERYGDIKSCKGEGHKAVTVERSPANKFILKDDDGISYYHGYCDSKNIDGIFEPLDWAMWNAGCTSISYKNADGEFEII